MWSRTKKKPREQSSWTVTWQSADFQTKFVRLSNQVGGDATVGRLSNNCFPRYQAIGRIFEKSRWTVTRQWSEVTRLSADCQTTFFRRFKQLEIFLKKVAERSRDSGRRSRDRRPTVKQRFLDVPIDLGKFWKKSLNGHATVVEVTRPSADCQTTFFERFKQFGKILKKVAERSRDSGRRSRDRRTAVKQRFLDVSCNYKIFWKKSLNGHATVVGGHATVGRLSNNVFSTFQAIGNFFEKSRWTDTRQWSEVTRPSADCQTTFFGRSIQFGKILKKVAERSRDSGWGHATVGQLSNNVFWKFQAIFWKKSLNGHATVVGGHATVGRLSNNVFWTFQAIRKFFEKSRWTVTRQWSEVTRPSDDCQTTFFGRFKQLGNFL